MNTETIDNKNKFLLWGGVAVAIVVVFFVVNNQNRGLKAEFFSGMNFNEKIGEMVTAGIKIPLEEKPSFELPVDNFSVRWQGNLIVPEVGQYSFYVTSDDGVRLHINGEVVIENWTTHPRTQDVGTINLTKGTVPMLVEYFENSGGQTLNISWKINDGEVVLINEKFFKQK